VSEYLALIDTSQTHSRNVHQRFYVKKRRALEEASTIPIAYKKITPACPELENLAATTKYNDLAAVVVAAAAVDPFDDMSNSPIVSGCRRPNCNCESESRR
jgi:hypothetical protein